MMNENKQILHPYKKNEELAIPPLLAYKKLTQVREVDVLLGIIYKRKKMKAVKGYCLYQLIMQWLLKGKFRFECSKVHSSKYHISSQRHCLSRVIYQGLLFFIIAQLFDYKSYERILIRKTRGKLDFIMLS